MQRKKKQGLEFAYLGVAYAWCVALCVSACLCGQDEIWFFHGDRVYLYTQSMNFFFIKKQMYH
jgi:branched-subunit amino acid aminotransferase/4-amino-4-deoxychorismate lyase